MIELKKIREIALEEGQPILREQSFNILSAIISIKKPLKILEIGVNVGCSSSLMLLKSPNAILHGIELEEDLIKKAKENYQRLGVIDRAKIFAGDAGEILPMLTERYDFIFLDGPKSHYAEYFETIKDLLNVGGILLADNVLFKGLILTEEDPPKRYKTIVRGLREFIKRIKTDKSFETVILDIEDGLSISVKVK